MTLYAGSLRRFVADQPDPWAARLKRCAEYTLSATINREMCRKPEQLLGDALVGLRGHLDQAVESAQAWLSLERQVDGSFPSTIAGKVPPAEERLRQFAKDRTAGPWR